MPKKIFIGGLSAWTSGSDLQGLCRNLDGLSSLRLERDEAGAQHGVAEFDTDESGTAALRKLRGQVLNGQTLHVSEGR